MIVTISVIVLCIILAGAAFTDLRHRKVFNRWLLPGFILEFMLGGISFLLPAVLLFFPVFLLYRLRLMGAGDGKVIMLTAGSLGLYHGSLALFSGFAVAAALSLVRIFREKSHIARIYRLKRAAGQFIRSGRIDEELAGKLLDRENTVPLAACISAGTLAYIFIFSHLL